MEFEFISFDVFTSHELNGLDLVWIDTHMSMFSQLTGNIR